MPDSQPLRAAVLISGGGTTLLNLIEHVAGGNLPLDIVLVISSNRNSPGLSYAAAAGIPWRVVPRGKATTDEEYRDAIFGLCREAGVDLVVMGGFLKHVLIPPDFALRVVNIHPSLIPAFCGAGFYGRRVHEAVLASGVKVTGCTVHFVDDQFDHGPIILQHPVPVHDDDTPETLAARVFASECQLYPEALRLIATGQCQIIGNRVICS